MNTNKIKYFDIFKFISNKSGKEKITILILIGVLLLVISLPTKQNDKNIKSEETSNCSSSDNQLNENYETKISDKIKNILEKVSGVGKVEVVVTLKTTSQKVLANDSNNTHEELSESDGTGGNRSSTSDDSTITNIYYDTTNGSEPYVIMENMPEVEGIIIAAQGGDNGTVASEITSAIEALLNVPAHKIKVLKMD